MCQPSSHAAPSSSELPQTQLYINTHKVTLVTLLLFHTTFQCVSFAPFPVAQSRYYWFERMLLYRDWLFQGW